MAIFPFIYFDLFDSCSLRSIERDQGFNKEWPIQGHPSVQQKHMLCTTHCLDRVMLCSTDTWMLKWKEGIFPPNVLEHDSTMSNTSLWNDYGL